MSLLTQGSVLQHKSLNAYTSYFSFLWRILTKAGKDSVFLCHNRTGDIFIFLILGTRLLFLFLTENGAAPSSIQSACLKQFLELAVLLMNIKPGAETWVPLIYFGNGWEVGVRQRDYERRRLMQGQTMDLASSQATGSFPARSSNTFHGLNHLDTDSQQLLANSGPTDLEFPYICIYTEC